MVTNVSAETRGVITFLALKNEIEFFEYMPLEIKVDVSGHVIKIEKEIKPDDKYDAIAVV